MILAAPLSLSVRNVLWMLYSQDFARQRVLKNLFAWPLFLALGALISLNISELKAQEWSEKDLAKSVIRAESTFESGELDRAYGLFAHLVSVAGDRAFLHFRFGAICTHTASRLDEAEEHLLWAQDLGIEEGVHQAGWHYYMGRLCHRKYQIDAAINHFQQALDIQKGNEPWSLDAKLAYLQCLEYNPTKGGPETLNVLDVMESHAEDYFRLYDFPVEAGRLLMTPQSLQSKEDKRRNYRGVMHWLPAQRYAFYSSYGRNANTGLDIYRVDVDSYGKYGEPLKLPSPINTDFDDCSAICVASANPEKAQDRLFFSSGRPESLGGMDVFSIEGQFVQSYGFHAADVQPEQLPFEINSTSDDWLYWPNTSSGVAWLSTNRNSDFNGVEVWQSDLERQAVDPISCRIELEKGAGKGRVILRHAIDNIVLLDTPVLPDVPIDVLLGENQTIRLQWLDAQGAVVAEEPLIMPEVNGPQMAMDPILLGRNQDGNWGITSAPGLMMAEKQVAWTRSGFGSKSEYNLWYEPANADLGRNNLASEIESSYFNANTVSTALPHTVPNWVKDALRTNDLAPSEDVMTLLQPVSLFRSDAVLLQNKMDVMACWEPPGSANWKVENAIQRFGKPVLDSLAFASTSLHSKIEEQLISWKGILQAVRLEERLHPEGASELAPLKSYCANQVQSLRGARTQALDLNLRIELHLAYEEWMESVLPLHHYEFRKDLLLLAMREKEVSDPLRQAALAMQQEASTSTQATQAQSAIWAAAVDSIQVVESLGIFELEEMNDVRNWFIRSGGLMDGADGGYGNTAVRGRRGLALAWEALTEAKSKRDVVMEEMKMTSAEWWDQFSGTLQEESTSEETSAYALFLNGNPILREQSDLYQRKLDALRTLQVGSKCHHKTLSTAIAMRSSIENTWSHLHLESGEPIENFLNHQTAASSPPFPVEVKPEELERPEQTRVTTVTTPIENSTAVEVRPEVATTLSSDYTDGHYTIQIGAFAGAVPKQELRQFGSLETEESANGLTLVYTGSYTTKSVALDALREVRRSIPDAFIKTRTPSTVRDDSKWHQPAVEPPPIAPMVTLAKPTLRTKFRVRVATFGETLPPREVARLLRLGNDVKLKIERRSGSTTYFTQYYGNKDQANMALTECKVQGFTQAVLEFED